MTRQKQRPFNQRVFVALMAAISGIGLPLSGIANHLLQTDPIALSRHAWMAAHWGLGIIFVVFAVWHAVLNRRVLLKHIRWSANKIPFFSREFLLAAVLVIVPVLFLILHAFIAG